LKDYINYFKKFSGDRLLINDYKYWSWCLRENQVTLGSSVLLNKACKKSFSELSNEELFELRDVISKIEYAITMAFNYDKINYLALMMIDSLFHYHIIPRYMEDKALDGLKFKDFNYPGPSNLSLYNKINENQKIIIIKQIKKWL
jgi:diadenosine tetraphosphate (Ap4A) HIT family hydrolase